jgi:hypothetical protein
MGISWIFYILVVYCLITEIGVVSIITFLSAWNLTPSIDSLGYAAVFGNSYHLDVCFRQQFPGETIVVWFTVDDLDDSGVDDHFCAYDTGES